MKIIKGFENEDIIVSDFGERVGKDYIDYKAEYKRNQKFIEILLDENKQLKMINKEYERLNKKNNRGFKITNVQEYDIYELLSYKNYKYNWNKLKEYIQKDYNFFGKLIAPEYGCAMGALNRVKDKMQELEKGSDYDE